MEHILRIKSASSTSKREVEIGFGHEGVDFVKMLHTPSQHYWVKNMLKQQVTYVPIHLSDQLKVLNNKFFVDMRLCQSLINYFIEHIIPWISNNGYRLSLEIVKGIIMVIFIPMRTHVTFFKWNSSAHCQGMNSRVF